MPTVDVMRQEKLCTGCIKMVSNSFQMGFLPTLEKLLEEKQRDMNYL